MLANFAFLSRADNRNIGGVAPSLYKAKMPKNAEEVMQHALIPADLFEDSYEKFIYRRSRMLADYAAKLCDTNYIFDIEEIRQEIDEMKLNEQR